MQGRTVPVRPMQCSIETQEARFGARVAFAIQHLLDCWLICQEHAYLEKQSTGRSIREAQLYTHDLRIVWMGKAFHDHLRNLRMPPPRAW